MDPAVVIFVIFGLIFHESKAREYDYCYANEQDPYLRMGTKTAYNFVHGGRTRNSPVPNCTPVQIWMLARHGTRYPGRNSVQQLRTLTGLRDQIIQNHNQGYGKLCNPDLEYLNYWQLDTNLNEAMSDHLTSQGADDMRLLARRLQSAFPELLAVSPDQINYRTYKFQTTNTERTQISSNAFISGLVNSRNAVPPVFPQNNDTLLQAYKNCPSWESSSESEDVYREGDRFVSGPDYQNVVQSVSNRLGFRYLLKNDTIQLMYDMCRYEKAWNIARISIWCSVFSKEDLRVLEYNEDLFYYYYAGPGRHINEKLACPTIKDMFSHFRNLESGYASNEPKGVFYFTHTVTLQAMMAALGIGKDSTPLLAHTYHSMKGRSYRTSLNNPFGANLIAIFYKCSDPRSPNKVMFYSSENPILLDGCNVGLCDWEYLKLRFGENAEDCNLDFCLDPNSASLTNDFGAKILILLGFTIILKNYLLL